MVDERETIGVWVEVVLVVEVDSAVVGVSCVGSLHMVPPPVNDVRRGTCQTLVASPLFLSSTSGRRGSTRREISNGPSTTPRVP